MQNQFPNCSDCTTWLCRCQWELKTASLRMELREEPGTISLGMKAQVHIAIFALLVKLEELWLWVHRVQGPIDEMHCKGSTDRAFRSIN